MILPTSLSSFFIAMTLFVVPVVAMGYSLLQEPTAVSQPSEETITISAAPVILPAEAAPLAKESPHKLDVWDDSYFLASTLLADAAEKPTEPSIRIAPSVPAGFISLFDGKTLTGWKSNDEVKGVFSAVQLPAAPLDGAEGSTEGAIKIHGGRAHLFYDGPVMGAKFANFELMAQVFTQPNANSGIYFHTAFQTSGWPEKGYECQINNSFNKDPRRTGSLYAVRDYTTVSFLDNKWMSYHIKVKDKHITITVDGVVTADYTEKAGDARADETQKAGRWIGEGTFALQAHDPGCEVLIKDIYVKVF